MLCFSHFTTELKFYHPPSLITILFDIAVKDGELTNDELEELAGKLGSSWDALGRRLGFTNARITGFHKDNEEYANKPLKMLFRWREKEGSDATYRVLYNALCHRLVQRADLAEQFCCK